MLKRTIISIISGLIIAAILLLAFPSLHTEISLIPRHIKLPLTETPASYNEAVKRAAPAVVNIYSRTFDKSPANSHSSNNLSVNNLGSGVIMNSKGYILTNKHVINNAKQIIVTLQSGQTFEAILVGSDELTDLAVLKIDSPDPLVTIPINEHRIPHVGDVVLAIGNPYNIGQTITQGIISATGRVGLSPYGRQNFIQTDASINQGNSGGALVNSIGELVGINTMSFAKILDGQVPEGIGFAIPTPLATKIMSKLIKDGRVIRGYIGIDGLEFPPMYAAQQHNNESTQGILVTHATGPAAKAGIKSGDILININDQPVKSIIATMDQIAEIHPNTTIPATIVRDGKKIDLSITVQELSSD